MKSEKYSRRALLRRLGASAAMVPLLNADFARGQTPTAPKRLVTVAWGHGICPPMFWSAGDTIAISSTSSQSLADFSTLVPKMAMICALDNKAYMDHGKTFSGHQGYAGLFTGTPRRLGEVDRGRGRRRAGGDRCQESGAAGGAGGRARWQHHQLPRWRAKEHAGNGCVEVLHECVRWRHASARPAREAAHTPTEHARLSGQGHHRLRRAAWHRGPDEDRGPHAVDPRSRERAGRTDNDRVRVLCAPEHRQQPHTRHERRTRR